MGNQLEQLDNSRNLSSEKEEKLRRFHEMSKKFLVDPGIENTVVYLNALGFNTMESCEGHVDHGSLVPRVGVEAPGKPPWRFVGQKEVFESAALKHGVTLSKIFEYVAPKYGVTEDERIYPENEEEIIEAWKEGWNLTPKEEETEEFNVWRVKTDEYARQLTALLQKFDKERTIAEDEKLLVELNDDLYVYNFFLHNGGDDYKLMVDPTERERLSEEETSVLRKRLETRQREMAYFTEFLKEQYGKI